MVRLEHVNLVGKSIEDSLAFYRAAFPHWRIRAEGAGEWYGKPRRWVHFGDDYQCRRMSLGLFSNLYSQSTFVELLGNLKAATADMAYNLMHFASDSHSSPTGFVGRAALQRSRAISDFGEGENRDLTGHSVGLAHFAFAVENLEALITRLNQAGYPIFKEGSDSPYRNNIYFLDPDGFEVEFTEYLTDLPEQRNA